MWRERERRGKDGGEKRRGFIFADSGRDMAPVGDGGATGGGGGRCREDGRDGEIEAQGGGTLHKLVEEFICGQVRYSLGTCHLSQMRGPVEGRLITMAADGGEKLMVSVVTGAEGRTTETDGSRTDRQTVRRTDKEAQMHCEREAGVAKYRGRVNAHHFAAFLITVADTCWQLCNIH